MFRLLVGGRRVVCLGDVDSRGKRIVPAPQKIEIKNLVVYFQMFSAGSQDDAARPIDAPHRFQIDGHKGAEIAFRSIRPNREARLTQLPAKSQEQSQRLIDFVHLASHPRNSLERSISAASSDIVLLLQNEPQGAFNWN